MYSKEILETKSVVELREIAKDLKIEGVSKLKKDELIDVIFKVANHSDEILDDDDDDKNIKDEVREEIIKEADLLSNNVSDEYFKLIPNIMMDGINENGVIANMNVVDFKDGGSPSMTTNPGKPQLYLYSTVRYILDHATSALHAIDLLNEHDLYTLNRHANNIHLMIADPKETYIVEFIKEPDKDFVSVRADKKEGDEQIMTNFYNNLTKEEIKATYDIKEEKDKLAKYEKLLVELKNTLSDINCNLNF